ncbi:MAG: rod shape-determining protein MreC [Deltaproteobacteria bacterium]|nr:rod shape-determining protein MreC [Deltaproteobacteria bacterium]
MLDWIRKFRRGIFIIFLMICALLVYSVQLSKRETTTLFEKVVLEIMAPFQRGATWIATTVGKWGENYFRLVGVSQENRRLKEENRQLRAKLQEMEEIRLTNQRLQRLLEFREEQELPALQARVIADDSTSWFRSVMLDKGSSDGVVMGAPVVVAEGVVGRVIRVAPHAARVLLITDASSALSALVQKSRARGVLRGAGGVLTMAFALVQNTIAVGDLVITSGQGGVFPKGIPVGTVARVERRNYDMFQTVVVTPNVDFSRLEEVLILKPDDAGEE